MTNPKKRMKFFAEAYKQVLRLAAEGGYHSKLAGVETAVNNTADGTVADAKLFVHRLTMLADWREDRLVDYLDDVPTGWLIAEDVPFKQN